MIGPATTTVSVLRGTSVSDDGDELDNTTAAASGVLAAFKEINTSNQTETSDTPGTVRKYIVRLPYRQDVRVGDRLLDERTNLIYNVDYVQSPRYIPANADQRVTVSFTD